MKLSILSIALVSGLAFSVKAQTPVQIPIPDTLSGSTISLTMHRDSVHRFAGAATQTLAFNQYAYLGPTLILNKGQDVSILVQNQIGDTTTVHWHGLHVAAVNDGGPHSMIMDGMDWNPQFTVLDHAGTYWYHPHFHHKTAAQAIKGAAGMIIVRDNEEAALNLPRHYGQDDFPIIVQSVQFDNANQPMPLGMQDSSLLVNGTMANNGHLAALDIPAQVVRLRLLNASGERSFNFGLSGNHSFQVIASDGGLLSAPVTATRLMMSPGERYQILIDASNLNGQTLQLMSYASEIPMGVQGGPTMPMPPGSPPMDSPLNGIDFNVLQLNVVAPTANPVTSIPSTLVTVTPWLEAQSNITRHIIFSAPSMMSMDGPFTFNNLSYDMERIDYHIPLNNTEIWELTNQTMVAHPFHIHDVQFYILDRDGNPVSAIERGRKDIVLVAPNETVRFIAKFETFADTMTPYVYHCHVLMHEDDGMMGQFVVVPAPDGLSNANSLAVNMQLVPNPSSDMVQLKATLPTQAHTMVKISNILGQVMATYTYEQMRNLDMRIDCSAWPSACYFVTLTQGQQSQVLKLIKQ